METHLEQRCAFCNRYAKVMRHILEELPPELDEAGTLWRQWQLFERMYLCQTHAERFDRYQFSVKEKPQPKTDEQIEGNMYRTPAGWEYQKIQSPKSIGWVRFDDDE